MGTMKRLSFVLVVLSLLSASAFASSTVLVPSQHGGLKVGIDALYLRPANSDLNYATNVIFSNGPGPGSQYHGDIDPSYDWGFYAQIGYLFPCTGNDLTLGYTYLHSDDADSIVAPVPVFSFLGVTAVLPSGQIFGTAFGSGEGKAKFSLNAVDLEGGQRFTSGAYDMRMFTGLRYANINDELQIFGGPLSSGGVLSGTEVFKSQFRGIGPRIGVDSRYCLSSGFGIDGNLSAALLVGQVDSHYDSNLVIATSTPPTILRFEAKNGSENRVIPMLEAKLGVDYTYLMDCRCKSSLTFEAGYQATSYFNAADHVRVADPNDIGSFAYQNSTSDVAFDGIYLGVKYYA